MERRPLTMVAESGADVKARQGMATVTRASKANNILVSNLIFSCETNCKGMIFCQHVRHFRFFSIFAVPKKVIYTNAAD